MTHYCYESGSNDAMLAVAILEHKFPGNAYLTSAKEAEKSACERMIYVGISPANKHRPNVEVMSFNNSIVDETNQDKSLVELALEETGFKHDHFTEFLTDPNPIERISEKLRESKTLHTIDVRSALSVWLKKTVVAKGYEDFLKALVTQAYLTGESSYAGYPACRHVIQTLEAFMRDYSKETTQAQVISAVNLSSIAKFAIKKVVQHPLAEAYAEAALVTVKRLDSLIRDVELPNGIRDKEVGNAKNVISILTTYINELSTIYGIIPTLTLTKISRNDSDGISIKCRTVKQVFVDDDDDETEDAPVAEEYDPLAVEEKDDRRERARKKRLRQKRDRNLLKAEDEVEEVVKEKEDDQIRREKAAISMIISMSNHFSAIIMEWYDVDFVCYSDLFEKSIVVCQYNKVNPLQDVPCIGRKHSVTCVGELTDYFDVGAVVAKASVFSERKRYLSMYEEYVKESFKKAKDDHLVMAYRSGVAKMEQIAASKDMSLSEYKLYLIEEAKKEYTGVSERAATKYAQVGPMRELARCAEQKDELILFKNFADAGYISDELKKELYDNKYLLSAFASSPAMFCSMGWVWVNGIIQHYADYVDRQNTSATGFFGGSVEYRSMNKMLVADVVIRPPKLVNGFTSFGAFTMDEMSKSQIEFLTAVIKEFLHQNEGSLIVGRNTQQKGDNETSVLTIFDTLEQFIVSQYPMIREPRYITYMLTQITAIKSAEFKKLFGENIAAIYDIVKQSSNGIKQGRALRDDIMLQLRQAKLKNVNAEAYPVLTSSIADLAIMVRTKPSYLDRLIEVPREEVQDEVIMTFSAADIRKKREQEKRARDKKGIKTVVVEAEDVDDI